MKRIRILIMTALVIILFAGCNPANTTPKSWVIPDSPFPFSQPGPYTAGWQEFWITDNSRGREIQVAIWYPAIKETDPAGKVISYDAKPDKSDAPYPLILTEHRSGSWIFEDHLVTHGFVMAVIKVPDHANTDSWDSQMINWPGDFLFSLDQIASDPPASLKGMIDTDHVGATGYSFGGDISLTLAGARIDPAAYLAHCEKRPVLVSKFGGADGYHSGTCNLAE